MLCAFGNISHHKPPLNHPPDPLALDFDLGLLPLLKLPTRPRIKVCPKPLIKPFAQTSVQIGLIIGSSFPPFEHT